MGLAVALAAVQRRPLAVSIGPASKVLNSQQSGGKSLSKCSTLKVSSRLVLFMLSFNFTHLDIDHSRGFGIITSNTKIVQEAIKLLCAFYRNGPTPALKSESLEKPPSELA